MNYIEQDTQNINECCSYLAVSICSETNEHCHLCCDFSKTLLDERTVKEICIGKYERCVNLEKI